MDQDAEHLNLLAVFHYVVAGITALFSLFPVIHLIVGLCFVFGSHHARFTGQGPSPELFGWIFIFIALFIITVGLTLAFFIFLAGRFLSRRRHLKFCFVMAAVECVFMPFGTVLGIFTILLLSRPTVKSLFDDAPIPPAS